MAEMKVNIDRMFHRMNNLKEQYTEGLMDKTELLAALTGLVTGEVISNSAINRDRAMLRQLGKADVTTYWSEEIGGYVTTPKD